MVTLLDGQSRGGAVEAHFLIRNDGQGTAIVSPGNFRVLTAGSRPRMRLREPAAPMPIGELRPGESIQGAVTWDTSPVDDVRVAFTSGADKVEWMVASAA